MSNFKVYNRLEIIPAATCKNPRNEIGRLLLETNGRNDRIDLMAYGHGFPAVFDTEYDYIDYAESREIREASSIANSPELAQIAEGVKHSVIVWFINTPAAGRSFVQQLISLFPQLDFSWTYVIPQVGEERGQFGVVCGSDGQVLMDESGYQGVGQNKYALAHAAVVEPINLQLKEPNAYRVSQEAGKPDSTLQALLQTY